MKTKKNRLFGELKESVLSKRAMLITKGGKTTSSDANNTNPGGGPRQDWE
jgi:hypothetical protein